MHDIPSESQVLSSAEVRGITPRYVYISAGMQVIQLEFNLGHLSVCSRAQGLEGLKEGGHEQILDQGGDWRQISCLHLQHTDADEFKAPGMKCWLSHGRAHLSMGGWQEAGETYPEADVVACEIPDGNVLPQWRSECSEPL